VATVGNGAFGSVLLAERTKDGARVAIKLLKRASVNKYVAWEIDNHCRLWHPHVRMSVQQLLCLRDTDLRRSPAPPGELGEDTGSATAGGLLSCEGWSQSGELTAADQSPRSNGQPLPQVINFLEVFLTSEHVCIVME
jgi:serine/threonine protein kinase